MLAVCNACHLLPGIEHFRMEWWSDTFFSRETRLDIRDTVVPFIVHEMAKVAAAEISRNYNDVAPSCQPESILNLETISQAHLPKATNIAGEQQQYLLKQTWKKGNHNFKTRKSTNEYWNDFDYENQDNYISLTHAKFFLYQFHHK